MPSYIIKLTDPRDGKSYYGEWSTVVDAPVSDLLPLDKFRSYYRNEYGGNGMDILPVRLERVEAYGTSASYRPISAEDMIAGNRAGPDESELTLTELIDNYG